MLFVGLKRFHRSIKTTPYNKLMLQSKNANMGSKFIPVLNNTER